MTETPKRHVFDVLREYFDKRRIARRLEELRALINAAPPERGISYGEIAELTSLAEHIDPSDVELLQWAGVPEFPCSICGERSLNGDLTSEMNGYNGNHVACEAEQAEAEKHPYYAQPSDEDGDPDALYDAAVDDAILAAVEDGRPAADWKEYMRGGRA